MSRLMYKSKQIWQVLKVVDSLQTADLAYGSWKQAAAGLPLCRNVPTKANSNNCRAFAHTGRNSMSPWPFCVHAFCSFKKKKKKHTFCEKTMLDVTEYHLVGGKGFQEDVSWTYQLVLKPSLKYDYILQKSLLLSLEMYLKCINSHITFSFNTRLYCNCEIMFSVFCYD